MAILEKLRWKEDFWEAGAEQGGPLVLLAGKCAKALIRHSRCPGELWERGGRSGAPWAGEGAGGDPRHRPPEARKRRPVVRANGRLRRAEAGTAVGTFQEERLWMVRASPCV